MKIVSLGYSSVSQKTIVSVEVSRTISESVVQTTERYEVTLNGEFDFETEGLYEAIVDTLNQAGVNIMPF
jgi:hypothetical protein